MANIDWLRIVAAGTDEILNDLSPLLQVLNHIQQITTTVHAPRILSKRGLWRLSPSWVYISRLRSSCVKCGGKPIHHQSVSVFISVRDVLFDLLKARRQLPVRGWLCHVSSCVSLCSKYGIADTNSITDYKTRWQGLVLPRSDMMDYPEHTNAVGPIVFILLISVKLHANRFI